MSKNTKKRNVAARIYSNKLIMFSISLIVNVVLIGLIIWLSRYAKIKGDLFASIIGIIIVAGLFLNVLFLLGYAKNLKLFRQIFFGITSFILVLSVVGGVYIVRAELSLNNLVNKGGEETVDYSVIGFSEEYTEETMGSNHIGYLKQTDEFEEIFKEKIREHSRTIQYIEFNDYNDLLAASLKGEIQYALVPLNFARLEDDYLEADIKPFDNAHVLFSFSTVVDEDFNNVNVTTEPFSILLLGNNEGLSDSIILATVNPQTLRITMTSLARDSYVPIACYANKSRDKLNHSRARGRQCMIDTVESMLDVEIDFYFETDFYALEKIIDALGGLEIESPLTFAGSFPIEGKPNEYVGVTVPKGLNLLDGKQAVTFARERKRMPNGDFDRQLNQQYVIREIATKLINERNPERLVSVLEGASKNLVMNLSVNDLTALLGYAINQTNSSPLDPMNTFRIVQTQITGETPMINGMWVLIPYKSDIEYTKRIIDENLSTEVVLSEDRSFTFSIRKPFLLAKRPYSNGETIGTGNGVVSEPETNVEFEVPTFTSGYTQAEVKSWGTRKGVTINVRVIDQTSVDFKDYYDDGQIIHQSIDAGTYKQKPNEISISVVSKAKEVEVTPDPEPEPTPEPKPEPTPEIPVPTNYPEIGWTLDQIKDWGKTYGYEIKVETIEGAAEGRVTHVSAKEENSKVVVVTFDKTPVTP